jgi:ABC-type multidrug transport system fused ATPase/permease subunit
MTKSSLFTKNIEQRVPNAELRLLAEKQIRKLLNKNQILVGTIVFAVFAVVGLFFLIFGSDSASGMIFIVGVPALLIGTKVVLFFKDGFYRRQLKKLGRSVGVVETDTPLVVSTVDGRGYLEVRDGVLRVMQTKGQIKQMNISDITNVECIYYENHPFMYAFFSLTDVICFTLIDDTNESTERKVSTNSAVAINETNKMNMNLKDDFKRRLSAYNQINVHDNSINKARTEISAGKSTIIIIIFSVIAISIAAIVYSIQANS